MAIALETLIVEEMGPDDIASIVTIERRCYPMPWHKSAYCTELTNTVATYIVARLGGTVVGYAGMWVIMDEAHITTIAVDPAFQGRGYAERLMIALMERGIEQGASRSTLEVREGNRVARHIYRKFGFEDTAVRKCYYTDNQENAIVMWAEDMDTKDYAARLARIRQHLDLRDDERSRAGD